VSDSNSIAVLERSSLIVYEADIFNCSRHVEILPQCLFDRFKRIAEEACTFLCLSQPRVLGADAQALPRFERAGYSLPNQRNTLGGPPEPRSRLTEKSLCLM
jgi:hypothetical protein